MSALSYLRSLLFSDTEDDTGGMEAVAQLLAEREATLSLTATFEEPYPNMEAEPTIVFPYTVETDEGVQYATGVREFPIPDNGLQDSDSALASFTSTVHDLDAEDVNTNTIASVEGVEVDAELGDNGEFTLDI